MVKQKKRTRITRKIAPSIALPGRALDLKAKDLISHLASLIIDQSERLVLHCLGLIGMLSANQNGESFSCILLALVLRFLPFCTGVTIELHCSQPIRIE